MTSLGRLQIAAPGEEPQTVILDKPVLRIGRLAAPEGDLALMHSLVSRRHAQIFCDREPYRIVDLGSSNGTQVNDIPLPAQEVRELHDGDRITIGPFTLTFEAPQSAPEEQPAQPKPVAARPAVTRPPAAKQPAAKPAEDMFAGLRVEEAPAVSPEVQPAVPKAAFRPPAGGGPPSRLPIEPWVGAGGSPGSRPPGRWLQYLPYYFSEDAFLGQYLLVFEDLFGPLEQVIAHFDLLLDPRTAPESFLPILAAWLGLDMDDLWPVEQRRAILRAAVELYDWRGTKKGLTRLLEASTGCQVEIVENSDGPHSFCVTLVPAGGQVIDEQMVRYLIEANKPAQTVYRLEVKN
ncbi:MAG: phage tail protein I [Anaerolineae bacterium]|nr:phage tail protein I [Anaerolineae bacterium]